MTDIASLSSSTGTTASMASGGHKHAHHAGSGQFQDLLSNLSGSGSTTSGGTATGTTTGSATASASSSSSVSGALGGLQHVLDLLQGVSA